MVLSGSEVEHSEVWLVEHLGPVVDVLKTGSSWIMSRSDWQSFNVVILLVDTRHKLGSGVAESLRSRASTDVKDSPSLAHETELLAVPESFPLVQEVTSFDPSSDLDKGRSTVLKEESWSQSNELVDVIDDGWVTSGQSSEHDGGTLTVSNVGDLLGSVSGDVVEGSWDIIEGHFLPREFPEDVGRVSRVVSWVGVFQTVLVTSVVSEPDIISLVGKDQTWGLILVIDDEGISRVKETVVDQEWLFSSNDLGVLGLDSEEGENITIFSCDFVGLDWVLQGLDEGWEWDEAWELARAEGSCSVRQGKNEKATEKDC